MKLYEIECDKFWEVLQYTEDFRGKHIKDMTEFFNNFGMKYIATDYKDNASNTIFFIFRITNEKQFFLFKVKYGL